ncbi:MAG TPA: lipid-transfer protein [Jatrophihabitantaceae bacterium]|nr:lipid-transfer protein [Jatrophihabitantaceae bacterium]
MRALDDAGLTVKDIDGFASFAGGLDTARVAQCLGVPDVRFTATQQGGGGGSAGSIGLAAAAIDAGKADVVVSVTALQQAAYRLGRGDATSGPYAPGTTADLDFSLPFGMVGPAHKYAMIARRHMELYGTKREHFGEIAVSTRANAIRRSTSVMKKPLTMEDYLSSKMLSDPLCVFDFCLESDGAVAVITTSAERARDLKQKPVRVLGAESGGEGRNSVIWAWANSPADYITSAAHGAVARRLWNSTGRSAQDVDVALLYDHFAPMVLFTLEDYGFCKKGEAGPFVEAGNIRFDGGSIPVNTHGGNLSEAYIMGMTHIVEGVEQIRGTAVNQVAGAEIALVTGAPAAIPMSAILLGRDA